jgi:hypothetical protein
VLARDDARQGPAVVRVHPRVVHRSGNAHVELTPVHQFLGPTGVHREVDPLARQPLAPVARHGIGMVERHRLVEIDTDALAGDVDRGDTALGIELPDRPYGPVRDV